MHNWLKLKPSLALVCAVLLTGCAGVGSPNNADEFRKSTQTAPAMFGKTKTFEVSRSYNDVSDTLRKKSDECLNVAINWSNSNGNSGLVTYKPTFRASSTRAELHIQRKSEGGRHIVIGEPENGSYRVVLDATPLSRNRTRIDLYIASAIDDKLLVTTLTHWVNGDNLGCPDLTQR